MTGPLQDQGAPIFDNSRPAVLTPDVRQHNPDTRYLRELIERTDLTQDEAAERLGITGRAMRNYLNPAAARPAPYLVQFGLECLAERFATVGRLELDRYETLIAWQKMTGWARFEHWLRANGQVRLVQVALDSPELKALMMRGQDWVACTDSLPVEDTASLLQYMVFSPYGDNWILPCRYDDGRWRQYEDVFLSGITHWRLARNGEKERRLNDKELRVITS